MASGPQSKSGGTKASPGAGFSGDFTKLFSELKLPAMPDMEAFIAANRRVTITLMREEPPVPPDLKP